MIASYLFLIFKKNATLSVRLEELRSGTRKMTVEDKIRVEKDLEANRKQWRVRKKMFKEAWDIITESATGNLKELMESIGIDTDEAVGVDINKDPLDGIII